MEINSIACYLVILAVFATGYSGRFKAVLSASRAADEVRDGRRLGAGLRGHLSEAKRVRFRRRCE